MSDFPPPFDPPSLTVPYPPPEVGEGSPWAPVDAENRDRILDWWRAWWRRVFFPWLSSFISGLNTWLSDVETYIIAHAIAGYSIRLTADALNPTGTTDVTITLGEDIEFRPLAVGDVVLDQTLDSRFGIITVVIDDTHATVQTQGSVKGAAGHGWWLTSTTIAHAGTTPVVLTAEADRTVQINDLVIDESASSAYGIVTAITDPTHVTVAYVNTLQGAQGIQGIQGIQGNPGVVQAIVAGDNITVDSTDPAFPIVSGAAGSGVVDSIIAGDNISVDSTDPAHPIVSATGGGGGVVDSIVPDTHVTVDATDPANPIVGLDFSGGGLVSSVVAIPASSVSDQPVNFTGTAADPELQFNLIETSGGGFTSEFGGPATNLRMKSDNGTFTGRVKVLANSVVIESFFDTDGSGATLTVTPGASSGDVGGVALTDALFSLAQLAADPPGVYPGGTMYWNTTTVAIRVYDGAAWH